MRRYLVFVVVASMAAFIPACGSNPTAPAPPGTCQNTAAENYGGTPPCKIRATQGWLEISYRPQTACLRAGTSDPLMCDRARFPPYFGVINLPSGYAKSVVLTLQADGSLTGRMLAPAGSLRVYISEPWLCPPLTICSEQVLTGEGVTINGTLVVVGKGAKEGTYMHTPYSYE